MKGGLMVYYQLIRLMSKYNLRLQMVQKALKEGKSEAARYYGTTRKTVRKWVFRYKQYGLEGLKDNSQAPKEIPHKMKLEDEDKVEELRVRHKNRWGARKLKDRYGLTGSYTAINRVIKQRGLIKKKKRRRRKRNDLSALKKRMNFCAKSEVDTKDLSDIETYWPQMKRMGLPRYEYTYRELSTGGCFFAYANENNSTYAGLFAEYVISHLKHYGVDPEEMKIQSDNGVEFIGGVNKNINKLSAFEKVLKNNKIEYERIPPRACYLQGDVETFHRIVEDELFDLENYENHTEFLGKSYAYQLYFNYLRNNRYRENKSPVRILQERFPDINKDILNLPPIRLESLLNLCYKKQEGGYHLPEPAQFAYFNWTLPKNYNPL
jgi:transposase